MGVLKYFYRFSINNFSKKILFLLLLIINILCKYYIVFRFNYIILYIIYLDNILGIRRCLYGI